MLRRRTRLSVLLSHRHSPVAAATTIYFNGKSASRNSNTVPAAAAAATAATLTSSSPSSSVLVAAQSEHRFTSSSSSSSYVDETRLLSKGGSCQCYSRQYRNRNNHRSSICSSMSNSNSWRVESRRYHGVGSSGNVDFHTNIGENASHSHQSKSGDFNYNRRDYNQQTSGVGYNQSRAANFRTEGGGGGGAAAAGVDETWSTALQGSVQRFSNFWRREFARGEGWNSPIINVLMVLGWFWVARQLYIGWFEPYLSYKSAFAPPQKLKVAFEDSHNAFFGAPPHTGIWGNKPEQILTEKNIERPTIVGQELAEGNHIENPTELTAFQFTEFDPKTKDDALYRSLHFLRTETTTGGPDGVVERGSSIQLGKPIDNEGEEVMRGIVKCHAVTPRNNCIRDVKAMESEVARKMVLGCALTHILRHPIADKVKKDFFIRDGTQPKQNCLQIGLGNAGTLSTFINKVFPFYLIDVVEQDAGLVRMVKNFMGFRESDGLNLFVVNDLPSFLKNDSYTEGRYETVWMDVIDEKGNIPANMCKLDFIHSVKKVMTDNGVAILNLPNHDAKRMTSIVSNWRLAFPNRSVVLTHCATSQNTILYAFKDESNFVWQKFGMVHDVEEFKQLIRAFVQFHQHTQIPFDLVGEVNEKNFQQLLPGKTYQFRDAPKDGVDGRTVSDSVPRAAFLSKDGTSLS